VLSQNSALAVIGGTFIGIGALFSIAGSDESGMIGTSRLGYALAADGLFPHVFTKMHSKFKTPYLAILIQGITALIASIIGELSLLIATSVFLLSIAYLATCASLFPLLKKLGRNIEIKYNSLFQVWELFSHYF
jgi:amino acid transporter